MKQTKVVYTERDRGIRL